MKNFTAKILVLFFLLISGSSYSDDRSDLINKAHEAYFKNRINEASDAYQELVKQGFQNGTINYNLGNIYFRLGKNGLALQYYEKALREIPRDKDLRANIQFVRKRIGQDKNISTTLTQRIFLWNGYFTLKELAIFFSVFWVLFWTLLLINRIKKLFGLSGLLILLLLNILLGVSLLVKYSDCVQSKTAIVITPEIDVHPNFLETDKVLIKLREGVKVRILSEQTLPDEGKWLQIEFDSQNRGWVKASEIGVI